MGVSGTLKNLSENEKNIIYEIYNIKRSTFIPSVYGNKNLNDDWKKRITIIEVKDDYNLYITNEINRNIG